MMESLEETVMESLEETVCSGEREQIEGLSWEGTDYTCEETDYTPYFVDTEILSPVEVERSTVKEKCYTPESVKIGRSPKEKMDTVPEYVATAGKQSRSEVSKANMASLNRHPPYKKMILEAMNETMERTKCSWPAIAKSIREKYMETLPHDFKKKLSKELRDLAEKGVLLRTKNSFKFSHGFYKVATKPRVEISEETSAIPSNNIGNYDDVFDYDDDLESVQEEPARKEERRRNEPHRATTSKVFVFKGTVHNPHFH